MSIPNEPPSAQFSLQCGETHPSLHMTRSARSPDNFVTYVLALLLGFPFTLLLSSADSEWRSHKRTHPTQICDRDTFYKQHTEKKKGNRKTIYWKLSDKNCQEVPRKILNLLPGELFCNSKNMALFLYVFGREPCFYFFEQVISYAN